MQTTTLRRLALAAMAGAATLVGGGLASAQTYPDKVITVIVPFAGGSASDVVMRVVLDRMATGLGQRFVVDNRPGAGGNSGTSAAAKATPDGYTLVMGASGPLSANRSLFAVLGYDPEKDFEPIGLVAHFPNIVVASKSLPVNSVAELIAYAKARPNQLNYGSVGVGSSQHLAGVLFEQVADVKLTHIPYRNIAQYGPDLIAGTVPLGFQWYPNVSAPITGGGAKALAVASEKRLPNLPDVPSAPEAGIPKYISSGWTCLLAPKNTPKPIVERLHKELVAALNDEGVKAKFAELGAQGEVKTPAQLADYIVTEAKKWADVVERGGIPKAQ
jgi:tripartite-type tricarboxylate transporter receptor subunit TctC